jgi:intracellular sulfur oxidation DsrE/DsrF family protein
MSEDTSNPLVPRRAFLTTLGAGVTVAGTELAAGAPAQASAQTGSGTFRPASHAQDDWMDKLPGRHRLVFDTTTPAGFGAAVAYANNFLIASKDGYGLNDQDSAVIIIARHFSTPFAYKDAMWAKYGKAMPPVAALDDPKTKQRPAFNLFNAAGYDELPSLGVTIDEVVKKGVHFAVCQMATRFFAGMLAQATSGSADAIYNELAANLVGNGHMVSAGIVAVNRAQEHGYTLATAV